MTEPVKKVDLAVDVIDVEYANENPPKPGEFPSVPPIVESETHQYTLYLANGSPIEVTARAPRVRTLFQQLYPTKGEAGAVIERIGLGLKFAAFPEAVVLVEDKDGSPTVQSIVAGWLDYDEGDDEGFEPEPEPEPEERPAKRTPKFLRSERARA